MVGGTCGIHEVFLNREKWGALHPPQHTRHFLQSVWVKSRTGGRKGQTGPRQVQARGVRAWGSGGEHKGDMKCLLLCPGRTWSSPLPLSRCPSCRTLWCEDLKTEDWGKSASDTRQTRIRIEILYFVVFVSDFLIICYSNRKQNSLSPKKSSQKRIPWYLLFN